MPCLTSGKVKSQCITKQMFLVCKLSSGINSQDGQEVVVAWRRYGKSSSK